MSLDPLTSYTLGGPCPPWCDRAEHSEGHPYDFDPTLDEPGQPLWQRTHRRTLPPITTTERRPLTVHVEHEQRAHAPDEPPTAGDPSIWLDTDAGPMLDAASARRLAAALLDAADHLDQITRTRPTERSDDQ